MTDNFLGKGWKFPIEVDTSTGRIKTTTGDEDILESIKIVLLTGYKERVMRSNFGSSMRNYMFTGSSQSIYSSIEADAKASIEAWEPRVKNVDINVYPDNKDSSIIYIEVNCTVRNTDSKLTQVVSLDTN